MDLSPAQFRAQIAQLVTDPDFIERAVSDYARTWRKATKPKPAEKIGAPGQPSRPAEVTHEEDMERGSSELFEAIKLARLRQPTGSRQRLIWRTRTGLDSGFCAGGSGVFQAHTFDRPPARDPCPYCGTRQDLGCKHMRRSA